jgi:hypothetical protein
MPKCDTSKALVALDGAMAMTTGLVAVAIAGDTEPAVALLPLSVGALYLAGAIRGNSNVNKCRAAMMEFENYTAARDTLPPVQDNVAVEDDEPTPKRPKLDPALPPHAEPIKQPPPAPSAPAASSPAPVAAAPAPTVAPAPTATATAPTAKSAAKPAAKSPAKSAGKSAPKPADDEWSDFWREVD